MDDSGKFLATAVLTIAVAMLGYLAKYLNDLSIARRKDKLDRVNRQLAELYGPLYALTQTNNATWQAFFKKYSPSPKGFWGEVEPSEEQQVEWRSWMRCTFMPMNTQMVQLFTIHADLLDDDAMPQCLLDLAAHVRAYEGVLRKWESGNYSVHTSLIDFPGQVVEYASTSFHRLKARQSELLGDAGLKPKSQGGML